MNNIAKNIEDSGFLDKIQLIFVLIFRVWPKKFVKRMCQNILARKFKDDDNYRRRATFHTFKRKNLWFWNENEWCLFVLKGNIWRCIHNFDYHEHFTNSFSSRKSSTIVKKDCKTELVKILKNSWLTMYRVIKIAHIHHFDKKNKKIHWRKKN